MFCLNFTNKILVPVTFSFNCKGLLLLIEHQIFVVGQKMVVGNSAVCGCSYDCCTISSFEVRFDDFVISTVTITKQKVNFRSEM